MSIESIKQRLNNLGAGKIVKYDNTMNLATQYALDYKNDVEFLLAENQRLVEALERIVNHPNTEMRSPEDLGYIYQEIAEEAIQAYKLLEKKD